MADNRNFAALEWVVHEISETLKLARQSLEAFVEDPRDSARIRFCLTHIHQVRGSLQMVEFHGAAMMAEEMEKLAEAIINQQVKNLGEAQEVLMRAILQFPLYLEQVKQSRRDNPLVVLPLLNDLRAVRGESLISETKLFVPNLVPARNIRGERLPVTHDDIQLRAMLLKLRQMYQFAAAGFIRGVNPDENLAYLKKVFQRLEKLTQGTARQPLWDICLALAEALEMDAIESSVSIKTLLRQLDSEIKLLAAHGAKALDSYPDEELIKNLLYYVARSGKHAPGFSAGSHLKYIYDLYQLEQALPEGKESSEETPNLLSAPDSDTMRSVVDALKSELDLVKHALDMALTSGERAQHLSEALPVVKRVADTMAVLGIGELRKQILEQGAALEMAAGSNSELNDDQLMAVAARVLEIENQLDNLVYSQGREDDPSGEQGEADLNLSRAHESVLRESRNGLEQAKDAIVEYIASQWQKEHLTSVPATLREIRGGLEMIPLPRPARILGACARYIEEQLLQSSGAPEWSRLDTLADAITSVEYYLERCDNKRDEENELLLVVAEESVANLGYSIGRLTSPSAETDIPSPVIEQEEVAQGGELSDLSAAYEQALSDQPAEHTEPHPVAELDTAADWRNGEITEAPVGTADEILEEDYSLSALHEQVQALDAESTENSEPAEHVVPADDDDDIDEEILEIFVEEAGEVIETIGEYFPRWAQDFKDADALTEFRRAFHTLKGSGRMVGALEIGELAWSIENMLNRIIDGTIDSLPAHVAIIERVRSLFPAMVEAFSHKLPNPVAEQAAVYEAQAWALSRGEAVEELDTIAEPLAGVSAIDLHVADEPSVPPLALDDEDEPDGQLWDIFGYEAVSHLTVVSNYIHDMDEAAPLFTPPSEDIQRALHTLKGSAHMADITPIAELVTPLERFVKELRTYQVNINDDILQLLRDAVSYTNCALDQIKKGEIVDIPRLSQFIARVNELRELSVAPLVRQHEANPDGKKPIDPQLLAIFMAEEMNLLLDADIIINEWRVSPDNIEQLNPLQAELANLTHGAKHANLPPMAELGEQLQTVYQRLNEGHLSFSDALCDTLHAAHSSLLDMVDAVAAGQNLNPPAPEVTDALAQLALSGVDEVDTAVVAETEALFVAAPPVADIEEELIELELQVPALGDTSFETTQITYPEVDEPENNEPPLPDVETLDEEPLPVSLIDGTISFEASEPLVSTETSPEASLETSVPQPTWHDHGADDDDELQDEIVEIFLEEAEELLEDIERAVHEWQDDWGNAEYTEELKRSLHTLKGGARLAGIKDVGDLAHDYETMLIAMSGHADVDQNFFKGLNQYQDQLHAGIERVRARTQGETSPVPASEPEPQSFPDTEYTADDITPESVTPALETEKGKVVPFAPKPKTAVSAPGRQDMPSGDGGMVRTAAGAGGGNVQHLAARRTGPQEVVKVSAELLEELVNLAGETSISRGRMEEQVSDLGMSLGEMDATIQRLQEQLRRLDIETEAQVLFRQEQLGEDQDFDPLEMDRYSQLQQLSRSLIESASDLMDLKSTLSDKNRDTETLLLQQSRINTDLQEGLMRSRMVPFSRLVPRLRRIVRQAADELGKQVNFELDNVEGELDRSVLERMVAPLEHMLRNAVDHGIESVEDRRKAGKPDDGRILLSLSREGGDVLLRLVDDGRGINLNRVREKAIERGLMTADAQLSDQDVMQFILHAGFSTAEKVTQISGRGVGMDVVHSEIKQLGGAMFIDSQWGSGTEFIIRLPFTVSVNRALMVQIGDDNYAIPLNTIEGIVRVSPFELEHYYQDEDARFEYAGQDYLVRYLGSLLDSEVLPKLDGQSLPLPVVLVRSAEHTVALQVDRLLGSREIVVKTLGVQFGAVRGLSGATITGDGSVVVILDLHALIREQLALGMARATLLDPFAMQAAADVKSEEKTVMVVDDSVTVRKVTSRFLEREGFHVITAKDGAEALQVLQDRIPDVMLLDIEMPRMDGFEVAKNIRTSSRLKHIPIIMITSRTGEKHRERAFELGVNKYMGKPYQEDLLLHNIEELLDQAEAH